MRHTKILAVIAGVLTCAVVHPEQAQAGDVYKYVDEKGTTLYTDKPIPGAVLVSSGSQRPPEVAARNYAATQATSNNALAASNQRIAESQNNARVSATVAKDLEEARKENCKKAREQYQTTVTSHRMYKTLPDGQRQYLTSEEMDKARIDSAKQVEAICGPQG
ncbi:MAG TPA: DUF4124 domain-containing protein [Steroidobacteraceae bacterium]|nr:DUF4124 domain-containing protein [Steroidobacteraceae bacterium]